MNNTQVRVEIEGTHASIVFFTEEGLNVLDSDVLYSFGAAIARVGRHSEVRTTSVQAEGKVFLAGADIKEMSTFDREQALRYGELGQGVFNDLAALPSITIAAINGAALGGGLEAAMACDFRIAVKSAKVGLPETTLGLVHGWGGMGRLSKLIGPARAKRLMFSGQPISAEDGATIGLIDEVVNSVEDLSARLAAFCKTFRRGSPQAIALVKRALRDGDDLKAFGDCFETHETREGMAAFLEKRPASWME